MGSKQSKPSLLGTEEGFLQQIKTLAKVCGWLTYHTRNSRGSDAGFPDLVLAKGGRLLFWELKVGRGKLTPAQEEWGEALYRVAGKSRGAVRYFVLTPADWDYITATLKEP